MKNFRNIGSCDVQNQIQLKHKINSFKHHILNLQKTYSKHKMNTLHENPHGPKSYYPQIKPNDSHKHPQNNQSQLFNRYEKQKLKSITEENSLLVCKLIKIDDNHSQYYDPTFSSTISKLKNNFLVTKLHDRRRSLSEILKQNQNLNQKIKRCASSNKPTSCSEWKNDWGKKIKNYSQNHSKKFPKILYDYRSLAYKQMTKQQKPFNRLKLKL